MIVLKGQPVTIDVSDIGTKAFSGQFLDIGLELELTNDGETPVFLLRQVPECQGIEIARSRKDLKSRAGTYSSYSFPTSSYFVDDEQWALNKIWIDRASPLSEKFHKMVPGEGHAFRERVRVPLASGDAKEVILGKWKVYTLDELRQMSPFYLKLIRCSLLDYGISNIDQTRLMFARGLRHKWSNLGYLWLDDIESAPIPITLTYVPPASQ